MPEFALPVDIANRACQHCGVTRIDRVKGFTENSKQAKEIGFVYGKLRQAELQRNFWTFAIKYTALRPVDVTTMLVAPSLWVAGTTYFGGSIVADGDGTLWISRIPNNLGNDPQNTPAWEPYFGPLTVSQYDATQGYFAGELVYTAPGDGTNRVFLSLQDGNTDNPATATAWAATATYSKNQTVSHLAVAYQSLIDLNTNNTPSAAPALFDIAHSYAIGNQVGASDGVIYTSVTNANVGHDPTLDNGTNWTNTGVLNPWTRVFVGGTGALTWLEVGGAEFPSGVTLATPNINYPVRTGPASQATTRNLYRLPAAFLRKAVQNPKAGAISWLGAPGNRLADDWLIDGKYLVTSQSDPIILRFVADVTDVTMMHAMFCEGLGARIGDAVCEPLTQSTAKKGAIAQEYARFMGEARTVDAIEQGATEDVLDDYLACRF